MSNKLELSEATQISSGLNEFSFLAGNYQFGNLILEVVTAASTLYGLS